ncbi:hypothetical protein DVH21_16720 [Micromonospora aurantiaca]|uniref:Uncharacterized protein n=1 Tax=Micromonospora aurantiaca (nom. illeg.) TaxID=47850 RepID=A0A6N3K115_9ACTN|nr:hypothetical protein DVH21_16720 [Micromonospora aurantiaca]
MAKQGAGLFKFAGLGVGAGEVYGCCQGDVDVGVVVFQHLYCAFEHGHGLAGLAKEEMACARIDVEAGAAPVAVETDTVNRRQIVDRFFCPLQSRRGLAWKSQGGEGLGLFGS